MKRLFVLLAALAATSAVVAGSAFAAPPSYPNLTCTSDMSQGWQHVNNLTVPAGTSCHFWGYVDGALTVNGTLGIDGIVFGNTSVGATGHLHVWHSTLTGNVSVVGGSIQFDNGPSYVGGNLSISYSNGDNSGGSNMNGFWQQTTIAGNFSYTNNYVPLYTGGGFSAANLH